MGGGLLGETGAQDCSGHVGAMPDKSLSTSVLHAGYGDCITCGHSVSRMQQERLALMTIERWQALTHLCGWFMGRFIFNIASLLVDSMSQTDCLGR